MSPHPGADAPIRIGVSGWRYAPWRGVFYPEHLKQDLELTYASHAFPTLELNGSFYALQRPESFLQWYAATTQNFVFSVKGPRYITHILRLRDCRTPLANFFASGLFHLRDKLGPLLWQLPANFAFDADRLREFFKLLPQDAAEAARLARGFESRFKSRVALDPEGITTLQHVLEVRHASYRTPAFVDLLREYNIGLVVSDSDGRWPVFEDLTAGLVYIRLHGSEELYVSGYTEEALRFWASRIETWQQGGEPADARRIASACASQARAVFCYFDNDAKVMAPRDARRLMERLRLPMEPVLDAPDARR